MDYQSAKTVSLKSHPIYNEKWLQQRIVEDTSLLGLGELEVRDVERPQPRAGRLDLLLFNPATRTRFEVEIQLGSTDESHIIRTIEYWDIERTRFPQYEHVAVIVAEDITSRFLNVISLFNKAIPLIAIQINALSVGEHLTLNATTVLSLVRLATEEEDEPGQAVDRPYWEARASLSTIELTDKLLAMIREATGDDHLALKYNKHYIGLARDGVADNFVVFQPRKGVNVLTQFRVPRSEELSARLEDAGLDIATGFEARTDRYYLRLTAADVVKNRGLLIELIHRASDTVPPEQSADQV
jgi:hypothetical protein